jgi:signal transduction histidine kinase
MAGFDPPRRLAGEPDGAEGVSTDIRATRTMLAWMTVADSTRMHWTLAHKTSLAAMGVLLLAALSSGLGLLVAERATTAANDLVAQNAQRAACVHELATALSRQGELTAACLLGSSPRAPEELVRQTHLFEAALARTSALCLEAGPQALLAEIQNAFEEYAAGRERVINDWSDTTPQATRHQLAAEVAGRYQRVDRLCQQLAEAVTRGTQAEAAARHAEAQRLTRWLGICVALLTALAAALAWSFFRDIFRPLHRITEDLREYLQPEAAPVPDDLHSLSTCIQRLKSSVTEARSSLAQSNRRLLDAEKLATVGKLAAGVAHEIRSPLTSLKLRLFSMQKSLRGDAGHENDIRIMSEEITRLDNIIRNFLEFSRPPEIRVQPCDISLLIDKTLELLRYKLDAGNIRVERQESRGLPSLTVDPQQFRQVLINLLNNAIDAQPAGGLIRITVDSETDDEGRDMVVARIRDSGPGIGDDIISRIFDPFFTTKSDGAGLGLWIAHRIISQHGGLLQVEKSSGRGTVFAVWIPTNKRSEDEQDTGRGRRPERAGRVRTGLN